ncbi:MAG: xanthine dehydrogenase family protein molybdopterin-binding subunit [Clostridiales bacterium]|nr:xanthine dehydrogenase family protein molybdopterin-binding subunit [Clostridiales bacterium]MDY2834611.1 xanthine dehydrogenase family protein molybdopterin-binding subunit [Candidatus Aphodomonas sp.]
MGKPLLNGINNPIPEEEYIPSSKRYFPLDRDPSEYKYVGKNCTRKDAREIVTGAAVYTDDYKMNGMIYGAVKKSPHPNAIIKSFNLEKAKALQGVRAVLTYEDLNAMNMNPLMGWPPHKPLLDKHVRYVGDAVALVAADTLEICNEAIELIEVEYEVLPAVYDAYSSLKDGAPQLYEQFDHNICPGGLELMQLDGKFWHLVRGDVDKSFAEKCAYEAEDTIEFMGMCAPNAPEPPGVIVRWDGGLKFSLWGTSQSCFLLKLVNESVLPGIKYEPYTFHTGGSYGNKQSMTFQTTAATALAYVTKLPVKVFQTKVEQMTNYQTRLGTQVHARMGIDKDGVIRAFKGDWKIDAGAFNDNLQGNIGVGLGETQLIMGKCHDWDLNTDIVVTNKQPAGIVRGYGGQELNSCLSMLVTRVARAGNFDPMEVFAKNYVSDGDTYIWRDGLPWRAHSIKYDQMIRNTAAKFGWKDKWKGWGVPTSVSADGRYVTGVGCSCIGNADVGEDCCEAYVRLTPGLLDDTIIATLHADITENGNGQRSNAQKIVAERIGIPYENVVMVPSGTIFSPTGVSLGGSRGTMTLGHAIANACDDVLEKVFKAAEVKLRCSWQNMEIKDNYVVSKLHPGEKIRLGDLVNYWCTFTGYGKHVEEFSTPSCVAVFVEVEVDTYTGKTRVLKMVVGTDPGQVIDPATLEMQVQGGIGSACLDTAFFEEHIVDKETGRTMTYDMLEYKTRPFNEFPEFDYLFEQSQFDTWQYHAHGIGEISGGGAASAAMLAISNAIGVDVSTYPATPDVILKALGKLPKGDKK